MHPFFFIFVSDNNNHKFQNSNKLKRICYLTKIKKQPSLESKYFCASFIVNLLYYFLQKFKYIYLYRKKIHQLFLQKFYAILFQDYLNVKWLTGNKKRIKLTIAIMLCHFGFTCDVSQKRGLKTNHENILLTNIDVK